MCSLGASHIRWLKSATCTSDICGDCTGAGDSYTARVRHGDEICIFITVNTCQNVICNKYIYTLALCIARVTLTTSAGLRRIGWEVWRDKEIIKIVVCLMHWEVFLGSVGAFVMYNSGTCGNMTFKNKQTHTVDNMYDRHPMNPTSVRWASLGPVFSGYYEWRCNKSSIAFRFKFGCI